MSVSSVGFSVVSKKPTCNVFANDLDKENITDDSLDLQYKQKYINLDMLVISGKSFM